MDVRHRQELSTSSDWQLVYIRIAVAVSLSLCCDLPACVFHSISMISPSPFL